MKELKITTIDAAGKTFGRLASDVASTLRGKKDPNFQPHVLPNVAVEIQHIDKITFTGKKYSQKKYFTHSRFPGGISEELLGKKFEKNPEKTFVDAVRLMLPANKLRKELLKRIRFS